MTRTRILVVMLIAATTGLLVVAEDAREPAGPLPVDDRVLRFVVEHRSSSTIWLARSFSHLGDPLVMVLLAIGVTALSWRWATSKAEALVPAAALLVGSAIEATVKQVVNRPRPPVAVHLLHETDPSFPSGHATGSAAFFVALGLVVAPRLGNRAQQVATIVALTVLAALVGLARVVLGVHWFTDVVAGWLLGIACASAVVLAAEPVSVAIRSRRAARRPSSPAVRCEDPSPTPPT